MQEKDHRVKFASGVVNWDVYLIAIANAAQCDLPIQKAGFNSWGCGWQKGQPQAEKYTMSVFLST